ncbi:MAG: inositol monophosphatase [Rhodospirillales bacterium]|nr:inositol monophosphatase [Rhodospirillales bacterium]
MWSACAAEAGARESNSMAAPRSAILNVMTAAAQKAARSLVRDFGEVEQLQVSRKGPADFVSSADVAAEKVLKTELKKARPDYGFLMEESGAATGKDKETRWVVDPLDGTTNFLHGVPHWSISIALEHGKEIVAAVVYDPVKDEMFLAEKGQGAFVNNRRMRVSGRSNMDAAMIATGMPFKGRPSSPTYSQELERVSAEVAAVRRFGSAALDLAYVAMGRYDGFWEWYLSPWDSAAGLLLVTEAGGFVTEVGGGKNPVYGDSILATNQHLHTQLGKLIRPARPTARSASAPDT